MRQFRRRPRRTSTPARATCRPVASGRAPPWRAATSVAGTPAALRGAKEAQLTWRRLILIWRGVVGATHLSTDNDAVRPEVTAGYRPGRIGRPGPARRPG